MAGFVRSKRGVERWGEDRRYKGFEDARCSEEAGRVGRDDGTGKHVGYSRRRELKVGGGMGIKDADGVGLSERDPVSIV